MENQNSAPDASVEVVKQWKGYTLDELRYQRVLVMAKAEMEKIKLINAYDSVVRGVKNGPEGRPGIVGRMLGALSYVDYGIIAFKVGAKLLRAFRMTKKKL